MWTQGIGSKGDDLSVKVGGDRPKGVTAAAVAVVSQWGSCASKLLLFSERFKLAWKSTSDGCSAGARIIRLAPVRRSVNDERFSLAND